MRNIPYSVNKKPTMLLLRKCNGEDVRIVKAMLVTCHPELQNAHHYTPAFSHYMVVKFSGSEYDSILLYSIQQILADVLPPLRLILRMKGMHHTDTEILCKFFSAG